MSFHKEFIAAFEKAEKRRNELYARIAVETKNGTEKTEFVFSDVHGYWDIREGKNWRELGRSDELFIGLFSDIGENKFDRHNCAIAMDIADNECRCGEHHYDA